MAKGGIVGKQIWLLPFIARAFQNIATAQVGTSFREVQALGTFRPTDVMVPNADHRFKKAKDMVLAMNMIGYEAPKPINKIRVMGRDTMGVFQYALYNMVKAGYATEYDKVGRRRGGQGPDRRRRAGRHLRVRTAPAGSGNANLLSACAATSRPRIVWSTCSRPVSRCATRSF